MSTAGVNIVNLSFFYDSPAIHDSYPVGQSGNQTQIMGLVELYRVTKDKRYLRLAERFINRRGKYEVEHHPTTEGYPIGDMVHAGFVLKKIEAIFDFREKTLSQIFS